MAQVTVKDVSGRIRRRWIAGTSAIALGLLLPLAWGQDSGGPAPTSNAKLSDWPQWRGPDRDDHSPDTGLLKQWPEGGPKLAWKATGIGSGYSTVSLGGGKIFTMGDQKNAAYVYAMDVNGGKILWSAKVGEPGGSHPGTRCTPTYDGDLVYALGQFGDLVCLSNSDGKEVWRKSMKNDFGGKVMSGWGYAESPLVDGDRLVCTPGGSNGTMVALDKHTGQIIWRTKDWTDSAAYASAIAVEIGGKRQYIQLTDQHVAGVEADTGKVLWKAEREGKTAVIATPVFHDNQVYVTSSYGVGNDSFKITASGGSFKVEPVYTHAQNRGIINHHGGVVYVDGYIYGYSESGGWTCQDFKTGKIAWQTAGGAKRGRRGSAQASGGNPSKGSIAYADGHLYLRNEAGAGTVFLIEANPKAFTATGHFDQPDRSESNSWAHPVIAGDKLYLRDQDVLLCYDVKAH